MATWSGKTGSPNGQSQDFTTRSSMNRGNCRDSRDVPEEEDKFGPGNIFEIKYAKKYSGNAPIMEKPKVLGTYSIIDGEPEFVHDKSMLHFVDRQYFPENGKMTVNLDLNRGWDKFTGYYAYRQKSFKNFLRWILKNQNSLVADSQKRLPADFISAKQSFTKIMRTPYNCKDAWTMYATEFKGSIYIIYWKRDEELADDEDLRIHKIEKWGLTFKHYMKGGDPEDGWDANDEYRCVLKTMLGETSLLHAPNIHWADPEQFHEDFEDLDAFLSVRCCRELTEQNKILSHKRYKLNQWWAENQLAGIPRILVGYRNDEAVVHTLELMKTDELPEIAEGKWDPNVCINFLAKFLEFVKDRVKTDPGATFSFEHESKSRNIYCKKMGSDDIYVLPSWYKEELFAEEKSG